METLYLKLIFIILGQGVGFSEMGMKVPNQKVNRNDR